MSERLGLQTLDPRSLFPTAENVQVVNQLIERVEKQLEADRERYKATQGAAERSTRNETLDYLALLNDWIDTAASTGASSGSSSASSAASGGSGARPPAQEEMAPPLNPFELRSAPASEGNFPVLVSTDAKTGVNNVQQRRCVLDQQSGTYYVLIKNIRGTIYGQVNAYQEGKMASNNNYIQLTARRFAIKVYDRKLVKERKSREGHSVQENPIIELGIQQFLTRRNIPFVMPLVACLESQTSLFAVFPFITGGELFDYVSQEAPLPEPVVRFFMNCWLDAVGGCHASGVCHRDISLENFLLGGERNETPFLIDFGLSAIMKMDSRTQRWQQIPHTGAVGKFFYMAPEVYSAISNGYLERPSYNGEAVDVWSLASCLFICLFAVPLYELPNATDARFKTALIEGKLVDLLQQWGFHASPEAVDLVKRMYDVNPTTRITIPQIRAHAFMKGSSNTV